MGHVGPKYLQLAEPSSSQEKVSVKTSRAEDEDMRDKIQFLSEGWRRKWCTIGLSGMYVKHVFAPTLFLLRSYTASQPQQSSSVVTGMVLYRLSVVAVVSALTSQGKKSNPVNFRIASARVNKGCEASLMGIQSHLLELDRCRPHSLPSHHSGPDPPLPGRSILGPGKAAIICMQISG
jgi:hypothetical protein